MAQDDEDPITTPRPWSAPVLTEVHLVAAKLDGEGTLHDRRRHVLVDIDSIAALPALTWLKAAIIRLKAASDCPAKVTDAARRLETEMLEAFKLRQCDAALSWGRIKNLLIEWDEWPRRYRTER
jgi:hypothetical protein